MLLRVFCLFLVFYGACLSPVSGAQTPGRKALSKTNLGGVDYYNATDVGAVLGLKPVWQEPGRRLLLVDKTKTVQVDLTGDKRDVRIEGRRVFLGNPVRVSAKELYISKIDAERCLWPKLQPAMIVPAVKIPKVIVIDPGHGGSDYGMRNNALNLQEKILTLDVALRLKKILEEEGFKVILTRDKDVQLGPTKADDFRARALLSNRAGADLFVSIHFNSLYPDTKTSGSEIYTFTPAFQRSARAWSVGEADDTEKDPAPVNRFDAASALLAHTVQGAVLDGLGTVDRGHKTMHSALMRGVECPAVLVEAVFLSNETEGKLAATTDYRQRMAGAIAEGIVAYAKRIEAAQ